MTRIRELRERASLSRVDLARALGVAESSVQRWDNGQAQPLRRHAKALAEALHCTVDELSSDALQQPTEHPPSTRRVPSTSPARARSNGVARPEQPQPPYRSVRL